MPVAEEMISLTDHIKKRSQAQAAEFRLHYFPNIPVDESTGDCGHRTNNSDFQRSLFKNMDLVPPCSADVPASETGDSPQAGQAPPIEEIKESAFQKGFLEGKKVGLASGSEKAAAVIESLQRALEQLQNIRSEMQLEIEKEVTHLALSIAKKIVCHEVKTTQDTVSCVAREALRRVDNPGKIKIKINPEDLRFLEKTQSQFADFLQNMDQVHFEAEDSIQSGGCLIETDRGDIDARIEKQFQAIEEAFQLQSEQPNQEID